jgi:hypothetical protein
LAGLALAAPGDQARGIQALAAPQAANLAVGTLGGSGQDDRLVFRAELAVDSAGGDLGVGPHRRWYGYI